MVETLKDFRTIILGHHIIVYSDHKNLTFENFTKEIVLRWSLMLEEYRPEIKYIKGTDNEAAENLSKTPLINYDLTESDITRYQLVEIYGVDQ